MVMKTNAGYGDPKNMVKQAVGLFATHMNRNSTVMSRLNRARGQLRTKLGDYAATMGIGQENKND